MDRRTFLGAALMGAGAFALDPERLLWRPGQRSIFLPSESQTRYYANAVVHNGLLMRGDRISYFEYVRRFGKATVWRDDGDMTEISFPQMSLSAVHNGAYRITSVNFSQRQFVNVEYGN